MVRKLHRDSYKYDIEPDSHDGSAEGNNPKNNVEQGESRGTPAVSQLISRDFESNELKTLTFDNLSYARGLRTLVLRTLLKTTATLKLAQGGGQTVSPVLDFLGFDNYERYVSGHTLTEVKKALNSVLTKWESNCKGIEWIPTPLKENLEGLATIVGLSKIEESILAFSILVHAEPILEKALDLMGSNLSGFSIQRPLSAILHLKEQDIQEALAREGRLFQSGLLTVELRGRYDLKQLLDLLTPTFHSRMVVKQSDIRDLMSGFVKPATKAKIGLDRFSHVAKLAFIVREYLHQSVLNGKVGANILIYGPPGTGKSQFARAVTQDLNLDLLEISPTNLAGSAVAPIRRIRNYRIAQAFYQKASKVLLFDEVEEVFTMVGNDRSEDETTIPQKSFLNTLLESNKVPTLWIANSVLDFDAAHLRRFDICLEMPIPPRSKRFEMLNTAFRGAISDDLSNLLADHDKVSPALIQQVADVTASLPLRNSLVVREECVIRLLNEKLRAHGAREVKYNSQKLSKCLSFDLSLINCSEDLKQIAEGLRATKLGRLCLYGPPGTGKTAFGKWIAKTLDLPHMVVSGSTLRGPYVGDTEKNIAKAFAAAKAEQAVLQLDEVDTFLADRSKARQAHEVAHINEMLVEMENYEGVFIASTNLMDSIDDAALRRFDLALKFDYLTSPSGTALFRTCAALLGFDVTDPGSIQRVQRLRYLTPGDFDQALRRTRLTGIKNLEQLVEAMECVNRMKKNSNQSAPIGFLKVA